MTSRALRHLLAAIFVAAGAAILPVAGLAADLSDPAALEKSFSDEIRPLLLKHCRDCHSEKKAEADLDLTAFAAFADVRRQPRVWQKVGEMLDSDQMPPAEAPQPTDAERERLRSWVRAHLTREAAARAGDPGRVVLRRLSNSEYVYTLRDLTGLDALDPAREFPVDGAAGEGFTNVGAALVMSPALVTKYLDASKQVAGHAVLLSDGFRFSPHVTRRDRTNDALARIREFYREYTEPPSALRNEAGDRVNLQGIVFDTNQGGRLPLEPYLVATLAERDALRRETTTIADVARRRGLNAKYLGTLWASLESKQPSLLLDPLRARWRDAGTDAAPALAAEIAAWQKALWRFAPVGHIGKLNGPKAWLEPVSPIAANQDVRLKIPATADGSAARRQIEADLDEFRRLFPATLCYLQIVPVDEVVTLTLFHREDDQLVRLMLDETQKARLDRLWDELHFVSHDALARVDAFAQLMEYATQDADPKVFEPLRKPIHDGADAFRKRLVESEPKHVDALIAFAAKAWRRPLEDFEERELRALYARLRTQELAHDDAFRLTLARVFVAPAFLYRLENPVAGAGQGPVTDFELASRLSYFLWSSSPDDELRRLAAEGRLRDPDVAAAQARRMLRDGRSRRLAVEFACQWLHIRDFDQLDEKSERHFPEFIALRGPMYEESIRFFTDFFQNDGSILGLLDADHTFLNEDLAKFYGVPGVTGGEWRRVEGMRQRSRGGILGLSTTLAKQSGASRTSPILRGIWISETLLGERLPRPPKGVPQLPEDEAALEGLTVRQLVEKHASDAKCAVCHRRIDPLGFSLEAFDAIGRRRDKDLGDRPIDTRAKTVDGAEFEGIDGLRTYLLTQRRSAFVRQFCRKLLGYALGRSIELSDEPLLSEMQSNLKSGDHRIAVAVETIVRSRQFREIRGRDAADDE